MNQLTNALIELKNSAINESISVVEIQLELSRILLSSESLTNRDELRNELDNELELIIYTLNPENQLDAAIKIIDQAIKKIQ